MGFGLSKNIAFPEFEFSLTQLQNLAQGAKIGGIQLQNYCTFRIWVWPNSTPKFSSRGKDCSSLTKTLREITLLELILVLRIETIIFRFMYIVSHVAREYHTCT